MLLKFGVRNYMGFREGALVSFQLDSKAPRGLAIVKGVAPILGIKGANASGKTSLLRALSFLGAYVPYSFVTAPDAIIPVSTHFDSDEPCEFYAEFVSDGGIKYIYELVVGTREIERETIFRIKNRKMKILERTRERLTHLPQEFERLSKIKVRKNVSIVSLAHQYEFDELDDIYEFFASFITNVAFSGLMLEPISEQSAAEYLYGNSEALAFVKSFIIDCDTGVTDIEIIEDEENSKKTYFPYFLHGGDRGITSHTESSGTRALFRNLVRYWMALERGSVMIADELDIHLHPHIVPKLLQLFLDPKVNKRGAQLIFTTHDSGVLDLLGKYRTYLVNKEDNESFGYRLDEISADLVRNDRPVSPLYRAGKIGGVPKL